MSKGNKGMTLVEVIIALGIIAIAIAGILEIFVNSTALKDFNRQYEIANQVANSHIEDLKSTNYDEITTKYTWYYNAAQLYYSRDLSVPEISGGACNIILQRATEGNPPVYIDVYNVKVTVTWTGRTGQRSYTTNTMLTK